MEPTITPSPLPTSSAPACFNLLTNQPTNTMSLLSPITGPAIPTAQRARMEAAQIKVAPRRMADQIVQQWERSYDALWTTAHGVTPAARIAELGTAAVELFEANTALVTFLVTMLSGKDDALVARLTAKMATIPAFTANEDGTVTLTPAP